VRSLGTGHRWPSRVEAWLVATTKCELITRPQADALRAVLRSARRSLTLVTPYVTLSGVALVAEGLALRWAGEVRLLTSVAAESLWTGACDPEAILWLLEHWPDTAIRSLPRLHAKVYVADDRLALVTSANLTGPGLRTNYEYGVLLRDPPVVRGILGDLEAYCRVGTPLGNREVQQLCALAAARAKRRGAEERSLRQLREELEAILLPAQVGQRSETGLFADAVYYVLRTHGPLPTVQIEELVRGLHPELCDETRERIINGRRFGKRWKHTLRTAQQHLRERGLIARQGRLWGVVGPERGEAFAAHPAST
jgi:PLD-like domain